MNNYVIRWNHSDDPDFIGSTGRYYSLTEAIERRDIIYKTFMGDGERCPIVVIEGYPDDRDRERMMHARQIYTKLFRRDWSLN